jgi:hypothetical protein
VVESLACDQTRGLIGTYISGPDPERSRAIASGAFITGGDVLIDGGVAASYFYGELAPQ